MLQIFNVTLAFTVYWFSICLQWNLDITKCQGTGNICSLERGFVISRSFFMYFTITGVNKVVRNTEDFVI